MENGTNEKKTKATEKIIEKAEMYGFTKKAAFSVLSVFSTIIVLFAFAFTQAGFDISKFSTVEYWTGFAMLFGISIWGMINGKQIGDDMFRNNQKGSYRFTMKRYGTICQALDDNKYFAYFEDWLFIYRQKKLRKKIEGILSDNNINQYAVLDLDLTDLVGEQITCSRGNDTLAWDVSDYDNTNKVVTLLLHNAFGRLYP